LEIIAAIAHGGAEHLAPRSGPQMSSLVLDLCVVIEPATTASIDNPWFFGIGWRQHILIHINSIRILFGANMIASY
jgi:hypothetical protein